MNSKNTYYKCENKHGKVEVVEYTADWDEIDNMYRALYWSQLTSFKTTLKVKWQAVKSLWYMWRQKCKKKNKIKGETLWESNLHRKK